MLTKGLLKETEEVRVVLAHSADLLKWLLIFSPSLLDSLTFLSCLTFKHAYAFPISPSSLWGSISNDGGSDVYWTAEPWQQHHNAAFSMVTWALLLCHWVIQLLVAVSCCTKCQSPNLEDCLCENSNWRNARMSKAPVFSPQRMILTENVWVLIVKYVIRLWVTPILRDVFKLAWRCPKG